MSARDQIEQWLKGEITATDGWLGDTVAAFLVEVKADEAERERLAMTGELYRRSQARVTAQQETIDLLNEKLGAAGQMKEEFAFRVNSDPFPAPRNVVEEFEELGAVPMHRFTSPWVEVTL